MICEHLLTFTFNCSPVKISRDVTRISLTKDNIKVVCYLAEQSSELLPWLISNNASLLLLVSSQVELF
jgi:hypothetical protein